MRGIAVAVAALALLGCACTARVVSVTRGGANETALAAAVEAGDAARVRALLAGGVDLTTVIATPAQGDRTPWELALMKLPSATTRGPRAAAWLAPWARPASTSPRQRCGPLDTPGRCQSPRTAAPAAQSTQGQPTMREGEIVVLTLAHCASAALETSAVSQGCRRACRTRPPGVSPSVPAGTTAAGSRRVSSHGVWHRRAPRRPASRSTRGYRPGHSW